MKIIAIDKTPVDDIVAHLRRLADRIERGIHKPPYVMMVIPPDNKYDWPHVMMFGKAPSDLERDGLLAQAQAFMTIHKVSRAT